MAQPPAFILASLASGTLSYCWICCAHCCHCCRVVEVGSEYSVMKMGQQTPKPPRWVIWHLSEGNRPMNIKTTPSWGDFGVCW